MRSTQNHLRAATANGFHPHRFFPFPVRLKKISDGVTNGLGEIEWASAPPNDLVAVVPAYLILLLLPYPGAILRLGQSHPQNPGRRE